MPKQQRGQISFKVLPFIFKNDGGIPITEVFYENLKNKFWQIWDLKKTFMMKQLEINNNSELLKSEAFEWIKVLSPNCMS